jgi:anti-sigma factor RsiW
VSTATPIADADVHAYADGQLTPDRAAAVEAALARDAELGARIASIRAQSAALRDALDPMLAEPIPERLLAAAAPPATAAGRRSASWSAAWQRRLAAGFAVAATLVLGVGLGWYTRGAVLEQAGTPTTFARQAAFTHALYAADLRRPVEVWASEEKGLVTWLTKRLNSPMHVPDLSALGYSLVGGRLVAGNEKPTALFMYENADKQRLSLQIRRQIVPGGEVAFRYAVENGVGVFYWIDDDCSYALTGTLDRAELLAVARVVYGQLAAFDAAAPKS